MSATDGEVPRVNWPYVWFVIVIGTAALTFIGWVITAQVYGQWSQGKPITGGWSWPLVLAVDALCVLAALALYWKVYCDAHTRIGSSSLSQPSIFGRREIRWAEVTDARVFGGIGYHIYSGRKRIVVTPYAYADPGAVIEKLLVNVPTRR